MAKFLVFNPMISASARLIRMDISTTMHLVSCKHILPIRQLHTMIMTRKEAASTAVMTTMKATATMTMTPMNRQKRNKRLGVRGTVVLIVIRKK